jgi:hypothetical protein
MMMDTNTARQIDEWRYERPPLYPLQQRAIFDPARIVNIEASTKTGKTVGCMAWLFEKAWMGPPAVNHWWVAPYHPVARIAYERIKEYLPPQIYTYNDSNSYITLKANRSRIWFKSGEKPDGLYGEDVFSVVMDEATRMREEAFFAIRTTVTATRAPIRIIGNVKGRRNWAYRMARKAEHGAIDMAYYKITAWDAVEAGILVKEEVEAARRDLPPDVFNELYLAIPTEEGANPFGLTDIKLCTAPLADSDPVVWGWDLARSIDFTVGIGLDEFGRACRIERWQKPWTSTEDDIVRATGGVFGLVDNTGAGDPVTEHLQEKARIESPAPTFEGYTFTTQSKQHLMEQLARAVRHHEITIPEGVAADEMEEFEYEHTRNHVLYSAPAGLHDDCVCALALAWEALRNHGWRKIEGW